MGAKLREIRKAKRMSQEELEKASGISRQTIHNIENGKTNDVMNSTMTALAKALDTPVEEIFFSDDV